MVNATVEMVETVVKVGSARGVLILAAEPTVVIVDSSRYCEVCELVYRDILRCKYQNGCFCLLDVLHREESAATPSSLSKW